MEQTQKEKYKVKSKDIVKLLEYLSYCEDAAGDACCESEGTQGCDDAKKMQVAQEEIINSCEYLNL